MAAVFLLFSLFVLYVSVIQFRATLWLQPFKTVEKHLVNRVIYQVKKPSRYDIIVFKLSDEKNNNYYVKRVVGLPERRLKSKMEIFMLMEERRHYFQKKRFFRRGLLLKNLR